MLIKNKDNSNNSKSWTSKLTHYLCAKNILAGGYGGTCGTSQPTNTYIKH